MMRLVALVLLGGIGWGQAGAPVVYPAAGALAGEIGAMVREPGVARAHWGVAVATLDGTALFGLNEGQMFQPASNAKLFTTAAAMALLGPERTFETKVIWRDLNGDATVPVRTFGSYLLLVGSGDANLSGRQVPYTKPVAGADRVNPLRYLEEMADQVAAKGIRRVNGDIWGDDTLFPWQPYPEDWAADDLVWGYSAPVSALTVGDNQLLLTIAPGAKAGDGGVVKLEQAVDYYTVESYVVTEPAKSKGVPVRAERALGSRIVKVYGRVPLDSREETDEIAIEDPAEYAALAFKWMLQRRGIEVTGAGRALHPRFNDEEGFLKQVREPLARATAEPSLAVRRRALGSCMNDCDLVQHIGETVATHTSPTLGEDVTVTNKESQNLHAELLLRQLGAAFGDVGSTAQGERVLRQFLLNAGIDVDDFIFYDGSGLSGHDLVTPRATVKLLQYAAGQPWGAAWKASLPVGGVDGSLEGRFTASPLKGHVFAKTGTLGEARALSGYLQCRSGRTVVFSIMVGNHLPGTNADRVVMDRIVGAIWKKN